MSAASVTVVAAVETEIVRTVSLPLPFQNGKFAVTATFVMASSADATLLSIRIRRNPQAENLQIGTTQTISCAFTTLMQIAISVVDLVPDGRDCLYSVTVTQPAAAANGSVTAGAYIEATAMSG